MNKKKEKSVIGLFMEAHDKLVKSRLPNPEDGLRSARQLVEEYNEARGPKEPEATEKSMRPIIRDMILADLIEPVEGYYQKGSEGFSECTYYRVKK